MEDLRIETYPNNDPLTMIRITHIPTGIQVIDIGLDPEKLKKELVEEIWKKIESTQKSTTAAP